jgi:tRNA(Ile)-lysidine synthase
VAVSGGLDSVVLLDILHETAAWHGGRLGVVTVDHGTRAGSAADADFVVGLAERLELDCVRASLALGADASELACREGRFAIFAQLEVDRVALGHHVDDQAETVLLQLMRGAGSKGLGAMRWRRGRYVRPLLGCRREELERWAEWRGLEWREDPTNAKLRFARNRVRHEVIPLLDELRPGCAAAIARAAENLAVESDFIEATAQEFLRVYPVPEGLPLIELRKLDQAIRLRVLGALGEEISANQLRAISVVVSSGEGAVVVDKTFRLEVLSGCLRVCRLT